MVLTIENVVYVVYPQYNSLVLFILCPHVPIGLTFVTVKVTWPSEEEKKLNLKSIVLCICLPGVL